MTAIPGLQQTALAGDAGGFAAMHAALEEAFGAVMAFVNRHVHPGEFERGGSLRLGPRHL